MTACLQGARAGPEPFLNQVLEEGRGGLAQGGGRGQAQVLGGFCLGDKAGPQLEWCVLPHLLFDFN